MQRSAITFAGEQADRESACSPAATPASPSAPPASAAASMIRATFGPGLFEHLTATSPLWVSSKTSMRICALDSAKSGEISQREAAGYMRAYSVRKKLALRTSAADSTSSQFPTPNAHPEAPNNSTRRENGRIAARDTSQCMAQVAETLAETLAATDWQTPKAHPGPYQTKDGKVYPNLKGEVLDWQTPKSARGSYSIKEDGQPVSNLTGQAQDFPTPSACQADQGMNQPDGKRGQTLLGAALGQDWATPQAERVTWRSDVPDTPAGGNVSLGKQLRDWPTPDAAIMNRDETPETFEARRAKLEATHGNGNAAGTPLGIAVQQWATPNAMDAEQSGSVKRPALLAQSRETMRDWATPAGRDTKSDEGQAGHALRDLHPRGKTLTRQIVTTPIGPPAETTLTPGATSSAAGPGSPPPSVKRKLNPIFDEWLMGFPLHWSDRRLPVGTNAFERWATAQSRLLRQWLSSVCSPPILQNPKERLAERYGYQLQDAGAS